ncbi:MAG: formylglycine-generating enzyme family protein [Crocosphaera sp.]|uniref:formylglycine-generating enzyme family protein n=1 Tax=Crocosphaera sp. TaxID=2729996 RepID=UPI00258274C4|nr:formylglycine-generating enzyme family protein [Crocosphaera sp.]MCH2247053.1 formylglycine-generating enzyme family protein [Crocosphaera sp.]
MTISQAKKKTKAQNKIIRFGQKWGFQHLDLVCNAAFPLAITPELLYCLRENFVPDCPWIAIADIILSPLCDPIGDELYEMDQGVRNLLLRRLVEDSRFGQTRLRELADFMVAYFNSQKPQHPKIEEDLGLEPHWVALAYASPEDARQLRAELAKLQDPQRIKDRLGAFVDNQEDLLILAGLVPVILSLEQELEEFGFVFSLLEVNVVSLQEMTSEMPKLDFETVFVNEQGTIIHRQQCQAYYFKESLSNSEIRSSDSVIAQKSELEDDEDEPQTSETVEPLTMIYIPEGEFIMGSHSEEKSRYDRESPQHRVKMAPFYMSQTPITQAQWRAIASFPQVKQKLKLNPSEFKGDHNPVDSISWYDAIEFCARLSIHTGRQYRLPSEAEWEYACRGFEQPPDSLPSGDITPLSQIYSDSFSEIDREDEDTEAENPINTRVYPPFHFGDTITDKLANYYVNETYADEPKGEYRNKTTPVRSFKPNAFGLYDMHGNVYEWCLDPWHGSYKKAPSDGGVWDENNQQEDYYQDIVKNIEQLLTDDQRRVLRGGYYNDYPRYCRSAYRGLSNPRYDHLNNSLRVVCGLPRTS